MLPFPSKRAAAFADIPDEKWNDWRWQLSHRLNSVEDFEQVLTLTKSERKALSQPGLFRVDITPYFASLIDPDDPQDPVRRQIIPTADEISTFTGEMGDSLAEDAHSPVPGLVHRYPDRVLMLVTTSVPATAAIAPVPGSLATPPRPSHRRILKLNWIICAEHLKSATCCSPVVIH